MKRLLWMGMTLFLLLTVCGCSEAEPVDAASQAEQSEEEFGGDDSWHEPPGDELPDEIEPPHKEIEHARFYIVDTENNPLWGNAYLKGSGLMTPHRLVEEGLVSCGYDPEQLSPGDTDILCVNQPSPFADGIVREGEPQSVWVEIEVTIPQPGETETVVCDLELLQQERN